MISVDYKVFFLRCDCASCKQWDERRRQWQQDYAQKRDEQRGRVKP